VRQLEDQLEIITNQGQPPMTSEERDRLMELGADLERAWHHPSATSATRKRILRAVLHEIVARVEGEQIELATGRAAITRRCRSRKIGSASTVGPSKARPKRSYANSPG
jgi:hypothetical protein